MGKRRTAREMALQMLYQAELGGCAPREVLASFDRSEYLSARSGSKPGDFDARKRLVEAAFDYARQLVEGVWSHGEEIDALIREQADNWRLERMPAVDRNILRLAVFELLHERETPELVAVDEAIELAKRFGSEQSGRFINGLLDGLLKSGAVTTRRLPEAAQEEAEEQQEAPASEGAR